MKFYPVIVVLSVLSSCSVSMQEDTDICGSEDEFASLVTKYFSTLATFCSHMPSCNWSFVLEKTYFAFCFTPDASEILAGPNETTTTMEPQPIVPAKIVDLPTLLVMIATLVVFLAVGFFVCRFRFDKKKKVKEPGHPLPLEEVPGDGEKLNPESEQQEVVPNIKQHLKLPDCESDV